VKAATLAVIVLFPWNPVRRFYVIQFDNFIVLVAPSINSEITGKHAAWVRVAWLEPS
jgi:hypothetical protein